MTEQSGPPSAPFTLQHKGSAARLQLLGFNAVRLPFSFQYTLNKTPSSQTRTCGQVTPDVVLNSVTAPGKPDRMCSLPAPAATDLHLSPDLEACSLLCWTTVWGYLPCRLDSQMLTQEQAVLVNVAAAAHCSSRRSHANLQLFKISNLPHHLQQWSCMTLAAACLHACRPPEAG